jgi:hypothetical protein
MEVALCSAYALFLLCVAAILEKLAEHSRRRADQYELAGFRYHAGFDRWECPEGNHLHRIETDPGRRSVRYRASAHHCNACKCKQDCTDSDTGREIHQDLDLWVRTGLSQFHRGLSLVLITLAALLLAVEVIRYRGTIAITLLGTLLFVSACFAFRLIRGTQERESPSRLPTA